MMWNLPGFAKGWMPALGPGLAALIVLVVFRRTHRRRITLLGTSWQRSVLFLLTPLIVLGLLGVGNDEPHLTGLWWGTVLAIYGFGEELGWRGFLQDALRSLPPAARYSLLGVLWGAWHFTTFLHGAPGAVAARLGLMLALWIGGSWGIGVLTDRTASLLVAVTLHLVFNYFTLLSASTSWVVLLVSGGVWVLLLREWPA